MIQLSPPQKAAVEYTGTPTLVAAGAGSGKTRTLVAKFLRLIELGYAPERILAITFTNKAAGEMKGRIEEQSGISPTSLPWVRTFHSACLEILKSHCGELGYRHPLQVWDEYHQKKAVKNIVVGLMGYDEKYVWPVKSAISNAKNSGDPLSYLEKKKYIGGVRIYEVYKAYQQALFQANAVDFDDIVLLVRDLLLSNPAVAEIYRNLFKFILIDEYQDSNKIQIEISDMLLNNGNLFVVGDDWQSIYKFRMSDTRYFLKFKDRYPDGRIFKLEQNYRSPNAIVELGNKIIGFNDGQMDKQCFSSVEGGIIQCEDFYSDEDEARFVRKQIHQLYNNGHAYSDMAVLYRTRALSVNFEKALRFAGIPYQMVGSTGFFDRLEILDLNSYLNAAIFELDDPSFERVINTPKRGIGPAVLKKLNSFRSNGLSLQQAAHEAIEAKVLAPKNAKTISNLLNLLAQIREMPPKEAIERVVESTDYMSYLEKVSKTTEILEDKKENVGQLINLAKQHASLSEYLEEAALIKEDRDSEDKSDRVRLSTIHAAKGLEYTVVFVVGLEQNTLPHYFSLDDIDEERRLFYVACTRAKGHLFLSRSMFRRGRYSMESQFLDEISDYLTDIGAVGKEEETTLV